MAHSLPESPFGVEDLRAYLEGTLPGSRLTSATVHAEYQPVLLLQTVHVMAAFAFSNGDARKSYDSLYSSFKKYYMEQRGEWDHARPAVQTTGRGKGGIRHARGSRQQTIDGLTEHLRR